MREFSHTVKGYWNIIHRAARNTAVWISFLNLTPSSTSENFRAIEKSPAIIIQKMTPGPPIDTAAAEPATFPIPADAEIVALRA